MKTHTQQIPAAPGPAAVAAPSSLSLTPWRAVRESDETWSVWTREDAAPGSRNNFVIAAGIQDEREAVMLAATPDLASSARELESIVAAFVEDELSVTTIEEAAEMLSRLRAAIARATGGTAK